MTTMPSRAQGTGLSYDLEIAAPPEVVWQFWVDPGRLVRWMGKVAVLQPTVGGAFRLEYGSGDVVSGAVLEVDPPRRLVFSWGWENPDDPVQPGTSRVEVELEPIAGGTATSLRLRHLGLPDGSRPGHDEGWRYFLPRLEAAVAS